MQDRKKTKIVATLGPAISSKEILEDMMVLGVNVFRINFSHADYEDAAARIKDIREINQRKGFNVAILADLQGPKLRIGIIGEKVKLIKDDIFTFTTKKCEGNANRAFMTYKKFPKDVKVGEHILVDDGKLLFKVIETDGETNVKTKVLRGGKLKSKKGVNLPNTKISLPALTKKDKKDVLFAIQQEVDWIALSFVRSVDDLIMINDFIKKHSEHKIPVIAKIEKPEAVENINFITNHCDGLMVARGDLGVEIPMDQVPLVQKKIVKKAEKARIPVIIATQMMESMITNQIPTRAEVNDVANSIMDGADAVMLSGETSIGAFPKEVISVMRNIIESVENSDLVRKPTSHIQCINERFITKSICHQAANLANNIDATAITTLSHSGYTAFQISAWRPKSNILVFTDNKRILAMLNLLWGVKAYFYDKSKNTNETIEDINRITLEKGYAAKGDFVINLNAMPVKVKGMVNTLRISQL